MVGAALCRAWRCKVLHFWVMNLQALFQQGILHICSSSNNILFQNNIDLDQPMIDTSRLYHVNTINFSWLVLIIMFVGVEYSVKALKQEREYLAKRVSSKLTADEIESLYNW